MRAFCSPSHGPALGADPFHASDVATDNWTGARHLVPRFSYVVNGNMLTRIELSGANWFTYTQQWDVDNRLIAVTSTSTLTVTRFSYDGDGQRVKRVESRGGTIITAAYAGAIEVTISGTQRITQAYYLAGAQRVATRVITSTGSVVYYIHADHLGSASLTTDASGNKVGEMRYMPYGETRYVWGSTPTDRRFTGQREEAALGSLYDYGARYYSPSLGRFLSADTIVPSPGNPQSLNRYSYVLNNALKYTDPTGHKEACGVMGQDCESEPQPPTPPPPQCGEFQSVCVGFYWLLQLGPSDHSYFSPNDPMVQHLMHDEGVNAARAQFYRKLRQGTLTGGADDTYGYRYTPVNYVAEAMEFVLPTAWGGDRTGFFLGSYSVRTHKNDNGTVTFTIDDKKGWETGSRSPFYYAPDLITFVGQRLDPSFKFDRSDHSVQGLLTGGQKPVLSDIFLESVLENRSRSDPGLPLGGTLYLQFSWTEPLRVDQGGR